jgi:hypothetical protein
MLIETADGVISGRNKLEQMFVVVVLYFEVKILTKMQDCGFKRRRGLYSAVGCGISCESGFHVEIPGSTRERF